jgi:hypothetical protein
MKTVKQNSIPATSISTEEKLTIIPLISEIEILPQADIYSELAMLICKDGEIQQAIRLDKAGTDNLIKELEMLRSILWGINLSINKN